MKISRTWRGKLFFIYPSFRIVFLVCFWEKVWFASYVACYYCVVPVGKHSNSRSQMFYDALQNLAIFTGKRLCWRFFLIKFIKKRLQHRCFPVNVAKCLSTVFHIEIIWAFWILCYVIIFLYKRSCKTWLKTTLPKNKSKQKL